ncbi:carbohydrate-binding module family 50 protein [Hypoxylon fragiforme]|uniref:carbohydrate-binding module family 50 protein n=1 Tax=Hypoxylon fragiforme TaxID=63214 RepID=UPI0020C5FC6B|nr:carbohydrate-binding module family 50 protein [Hypoxylon fragiforme]KAI2612180.1 carbohydrate-binding module family 50 protein [Hypoxylon fragiforme]
MGRWSQYDTDEERLPEGMKRIGYDADDQVYTFRDTRDGSIWESAPGNRYGQLRRVQEAAPPPYEEEEEEDADSAKLLHGKNGADAGSSWRHDMMPLLNWFLLVGVFLLLIFWSISGSATKGGKQGGADVPGTAITCDEEHGSSRTYSVRAGDICWAIAENHGVSVEALVQENRGLDCDSLRVGATICVPA